MCAQMGLGGPDRSAKGMRLSTDLRQIAKDILALTVVSNVGLLDSGYRELGLLDSFRLL